MKHNPTIRIPPLVVASGEGLAGAFLAWSTEKSDERKEKISREEDRSDHKLHLVLDTESFARLAWLRNELEAASDTEVIRRALKAYEIFDPEYEEDENLSAHKEKSSSSNTTKKHHIYIRISDKVMERLNSESNEKGITYGEQLKNALCVLFQLVRDRQRMLDELNSVSRKPATVPNAKARNKESPDVTEMRKLLAMC